MANRTGRIKTTGGGIKMTYKCYDCGETFNEPKTVKEPHGEVLACCPYCNGSFNEAKKCRICGEYFFEEELNGGCVCDDCVEEYKGDLKTCYAIAETTEKQEIKINALLASIFDIAEIEENLYQKLESININNDTLTLINFSAFINEDRDWFAEKLAEEVSE
jgi:DNA-directed RNA polymerase subunit RPC12/RpoP